MAARTGPATVGKPPSKIGVAIAMVVVVLAVRMSRTETDASPPTSTASEEKTVLPLVGTPTPSVGEPAPVESSLETVVGMGVADARRAVEALGASGAKLYSENCYAALASKPSDSVRNRCHAFDRTAARLLEAAGDQSEAYWFSEGVTSDRYRQSFGSDEGDVEAALARVDAAVSNIAPPADPTSVGSASADDSEETAEDATDPMREPSIGEPTDDAGGEAQPTEPPTTSADPPTT